MKNKLTFVILLAASPAFAITPNSFSTNQVRVIDGDTIEVIPSNRKSERVRLLGIDAPESNQAYGKKSTSTLSQCVQDKTVTIQWFQRDQYSRLLGKVWANGVDCNLHQVKIGSAWHYKYYQNQQQPADQISYSNAEADARKNKLGLWRNPNAINPYQFRRMYKAR